jgi:uncharacterized membrane protein
MTRFELLAMLHGLGVIAWVGGGLALLMLHALAVRSDDYDGLATAVRQSRVLGAYLYGPASIVTATTGIVLVASEDAFDLTDLWILIGIGGVLLSIPLQVIVPTELGRSTWRSRPKRTVTRSPCELQRAPSRSSTPPTSRSC